jgi:hypothetical protein
MIMGRIMPVLFAALLVITLGIMGCGEESEKFLVKEKAESSDLELPTTGLSGDTYANYEYLFRVSNLPVDEWEVIAVNVKEPGTQGYNDIVKLVEAKSPKGDGLITVKVEFLKRAEEWSGKGYIEKLIAQNRERGVEPSSRGSVKGKNASGYQVTYRLDDACWRLVMFVRSKKGYRLSLQATPEKFDEYLPLLERMAGTFMFL